MQATIPTVFDDPGVNGGYGHGGMAGTTITQNVKVITPKPLNERELVREFTKLSKKLAIGV